MTRLDELTDHDREAVLAFGNFLAWAGQPSRREHRVPGRRAWPPAVYAYAFGASGWCPPEGEL